jgi:hypothetical protein
VEIIKYVIMNEDMYGYNNDLLKTFHYEERPLGWYNGLEELDIAKLQVGT